MHISCSYIVVIESHELHVYTISHTVSCILCNSCDLSNSTHTYKNTLSCNELQMVIATQNPNCKALQITFFSQWIDCGRIGEGEFGRCWNDNLETLVRSWGEEPFAPRILCSFTKEYCRSLKVEMKKVMNHCVCRILPNCRFNRVLDLCVYIGYID